MDKSTYLLDPCGVSSLPFWKTNSIPIPEDLLIPVDTVFSVYDEIRLGEHETRLYKNGVRLRPDQTGREICPGLFRVYGSDGGFLGTGGFEGGAFRCRTNFY